MHSSKEVECLLGAGTTLGLICFFKIVHCSLFLSEVCGPKTGQRLKIEKRARCDELLDNNHKLGSRFYFYSDLFVSQLCGLFLNIQTAGKGGRGRWRGCF